MKKLNSMNKRKKSIYYLALTNTILALLMSLFGFFFQQIYNNRINSITLYELKGQDTITFIIAAIFLFIILFTDYNKIKTKIIWLGCLLYLFYIYAYFSLGGITGIFYLVYIAITGLSLFIFIFIIAEINVTKILPAITSKYPRKAISVFLIISIFLMTVIEVQEIYIKSVITKENINPFYVFYVLDLGIVFPAIIISAIMNLRKQAWGYLFSGVALIKIVTILPAVIFNDIFYWFATGKFLDLSFDIIAIVITVIAFIFLILYTKAIKDKKMCNTSHNT